jgi:glycosyltransferase involved in cell wall biosynthesis
MVSVLYLTANPNRASSNVPTEGWLRLLPGRGLRPVIVSHRDGAFCEWARSRAIPAYVIPLPMPDKRRPWEYLATLWTLRRIVRAAKVQLVHAIEQNVYPIAADLARICGLPAVVGVHCRMERGFGEWAFGGRRRPARLFFLTHGSREVCRSAVTGIVPESNWRLLPNGLDIATYCPDPGAGRQFCDERGLGKGPFIGAASWLRPGKQLEHLFQVMSTVRNPSVTLLLAGGVAPGEEAYAEKLLADGQQRLGQRLRFLGCLDDLRGFYNALDLYINTSKAETCSISIIESLACGCPVVGYPSVSVDEQVLPSGGEIVPQDDCEELSNAVARWLDDDNRRAEARHGARARAEESFDIRKLADQLWDEYSDLLAERNGARVRPIVEACGLQVTR